MDLPFGSASGFILSADKQQFLLARGKRSAQLFLPGGKISNERNETPLATFLRHAQSNAGITVLYPESVEVLYTISYCRSEGEFLHRVFFYALSAPEMIRTACEFGADWFAVADPPFRYIQNYIFIDAINEARRRLGHIPPSGLPMGKREYTAHMKPLDDEHGRAVYLRMKKHQ